MKIYAVYIIDSNGKSMLSEVYQSPENVPPEALLGALLTTIQVVAQDLTKEENSAQLFKLSGVSYHMKSFRTFHIALVTDDDTPPISTLNKIGWQFIQEYGESIESWLGQKDAFDGFRSNLNTIISKKSIIDQSQSIEPSKRLDPVNMLKLPKELKKTAGALLLLDSASLKEICSETKEQEKTVKSNLKRLMEMGYIGFYLKKNKDIYFC